MSLAISSFCKMRGVVLLMMLAYFGVTCAQQKQLKFEITEFSQDLNDGAAQSKEYQKMDGSGNLYAIIKVKSADPTVTMDLNAFKFSFGNMNHEVKIHEDELWVYVQKNARKVTIRRDGYAPIKDYDLKTTIEAGRTYVMKLTFDKVITTTVMTLKKQWVKFTLSPPIEGATISLMKKNESTPFETFTTDKNGTVSQNLDFGTYFYEVKADKYVNKSGKVVLSSSDVTMQEAVELTPNFGYIEVKDMGNAAGARILVDSRFIGTVPYTGKEQLDCGEHTIQLIKDLYKPYNSTFVIKQGQTVTLSPELESNFAEATLTVENGAEIYVDGQKKGQGTWKGPLKAGTYIVECKKESHRSTQKRITIEPDVASTIELDAPVPITGFLSVSSTPDGALIDIDGRSYGQTPRNISDMLIGSHQLKLSKKGHRAHVETINIEEGKQHVVDVKLFSEDTVTIVCNPSYGRITLNGKYLGYSPCKVLLSNGFYNIEAEAYDEYTKYKKKVRIDVSNPNFNIKLKRIFAKKNCFYLEGVMQPISMMAWGGNMGFHANHFNMEAFCMMALEDLNLYVPYETEDGGLVSNGNKVKPQFYAGGRVGWGYRLGRFVRFTPQLGANYLRMRSETLDENKEVENSYSLSGVVGLRSEFSFSTHFGISVTPEYSIRLSSGDRLKQACKTNETLKGWTEGFNLRAGIFFFF